MRQYKNHLGQPMTPLDYSIAERLFSGMQFEIVDETRHRLRPINYPEIEAEGASYHEALDRLEEILMCDPRFLFKVYWPF